MCPTCDSSQLCSLFKNYTDAPELLLAVFYSNLNLLLNFQSLCDSELCFQHQLHPLT